jgi:hypothetical protein
MFLAEEAADNGEYRDDSYGNVWRPLSDIGLCCESVRPEEPMQWQKAK